MTTLNGKAHKQRVHRDHMNHDSLSLSIIHTMSCPVELPKDDERPSKADALLDPSTFVFPPPLTTTTVTVEFCDRVRV